MAKTTVISQEALQRQLAFCNKINTFWRDQGITPKAYVETYGCQQNEADSERIRGLLVESGYAIVNEAEGADVVVMNTCAIREHAEQRVFGNLGALTHTKRRHPRQKIFLCGCTLTRGTVVDSLQLWQQPVASLLIKKACIGSMIDGQGVLLTDLLVGQGDQGYLHPHLRHGEEAEHELIGVKAADGLFLMELTQYLRGEGVHRHHPATELHRQRTKACCMGFRHPVLLHCVDE